MKLFVVVCSLLLALAAGAPKADLPADASLRIGVKYRPDECDVKAKAGDSVSVHYTGTLYADGSKFDSSRDRAQPFTLTLGRNSVIRGWEEGLLGMCEGEKRKLIIPSGKGYGASGSPPKIPGGATLVFEVEMMKIN